MKVPKMMPSWLRHYQRANINQDIVAGIIVGILAIPQSLGYAVLAGLPPVYGLYSALVPVLIYAWNGASSVNAVGPVAITAIMTAQVLQPYQQLPSLQYAALASFLALLVGLLLWLASVLRLGWVTQFISRGVSAGFISAAALLIILSQLKFIGGFKIHANTLPDYIGQLAQHIGQPQFISVPTVLVGATAMGILIVNRYFLQRLLQRFLSKTIALWTVRLLPLGLMLSAIVASCIFNFASHGIATIGQVPQGLPHFAVPFPLTISVFGLLVDLLPAAGLLALVAFISSDSVAANFARQRRQYYDSNLELRGLGMANVAGAFFQSFPVVGGFSRTALNVDAGAQTPLASLIAVAVMAIMILLFANVLTPLPYAVLAATIIVAITSLIDGQTLKQAWRSDRLDGWAFLLTLAAVLLFGLNIGLLSGILFSFVGLIWQSSRPHIAIVGQVGDSGHFRNIQRHAVTESPHMLIIRIDESLFYGNARAVQQFIEQAVVNREQCRHVILVLSAVNHVDLTAQEMLITLNRQLQQQQKTLHYAEIKGPVMDILKTTAVIGDLSGQVFLSTRDAVEALRH